MLNQHYNQELAFNTFLEITSRAHSSCWHGAILAIRNMHQLYTNRNETLLITRLGSKAMLLEYQSLDWGDSATSAHPRSTRVTPVS